MVVQIEYLLYGAVFLCALLLIEGLYYLHADSQAGRETVNRRMKMLASGKPAREVYEILKRKPKHAYSHLGEVGNLLNWFEQLITQSGLTVSMNRMFLIMGALTLFSFFAMAWLSIRFSFAPSIGATAFAMVLALVIGIGLPIIHLSKLKDRRLKMFSEQLPEALDVMVRSLLAGHPVNAAMNLVTKEMPDPIGSEFGIAVDEMTYGLDLRDALGNMGSRIDLEDFQYVLVSINIQHETGGNLAEVLSSLSRIMRDRFRMFKKIRVLSAEGRLSAKILAILPFIFAGFLMLRSPDYYLDAAEDDLFWPFVLGALVLEAVGIYIMHRLVNFRV